ncbi:hypothetical protein KQX54_000369, partial [Cotesia glomerata]
IRTGWLLSPGICDIWTVSDVLCCTASILHLVAIAMDRFWAVTNTLYTGYPQKDWHLNCYYYWVVSLKGISMAPQLGWKDPGFMEHVL